MCFRPRGFLNEVSDEPDGKEADQEGGKAAAEIGDDGALAAGEGGDGQARHFRRGLQPRRLKTPARATSKNSLSVVPGQSAVTLMPNRATSAARPSAKKRSKTLVAA